MSSIRKVGDKWRAQIRRTGQKSISKMHDTKAAAERWAREVESQIDKGEYARPTTDTIGDVIAVYRTLREESEHPIRDTSSEHYMLNYLTDKLGTKKAHQLDVDDILEYARRRRTDGVAAYTVNMEISKLGTVMRYVASVTRVTLPDAIGAARPALRHFKLIGGSNFRERRPTEDELFRIKEWLRQQTYSPICLRMPDVIDVVSQVALRRGETFRLLWEDLNEKDRVILVRDRKDPRRKIGNHQLVPLIGSAFDIIMRQPRTDERIFPFAGSTVSHYFTDACRALSIPDLHWHDLRHESASALADASWTPHEIRAVTGHKTTAKLDRYVNIDPRRIVKKKIARPSEEEPGDQVSG